MAKQNSSPVFNAEAHIKELNERFSRLIKNVGFSNKKGTDRYNFEVDFSYALNEIQFCPTYMQGKMFDKASGVVNSLITFLRENNEDTVEA
jgi:hypothetical protein